jgi:hypothetical protein
MSTIRYFLKKVPNNPVWLSNGAKVPFVPLGEETAILATEDELTIKELDEVIAQKILGVVALSKERYDELLKKKPSLRQLSLPSPSTPESLEPLSQPTNPILLQSQEEVVAPADGDATDAATEEKPDDGPVRGRRGRPKKVVETAP